MVAYIDRDHLVEGVMPIRAGLVVGITGGKRVIRCAATGLLEDAPKRHGRAVVGMHWKDRRE